MKKIIFLVIFCVSSIINAQHCPYCGSSIIVLKVHTKDNQNTIPNLKIALINKKNDTKNTDYILTRKSKFPFLTDEYSITVPYNFDIENWYLKIESYCDYEGNDWFNYGNAEIYLTENDKYSLCRNFISDEYSLNEGERVYKPIEVILGKKKCKSIIN